MLSKLVAREQVHCVRSSSFELEDRLRPATRAQRNVQAEAENRPKDKGATGASVVEACTLFIPPLTSRLQLTQEMPRNNRTLTFCTSSVFSYTLSGGSAFR